MIKSSTNYNLHPLMQIKNGNKILDYEWRTRVDQNFIPQIFNNKIVFQSYDSFQQNNLFLSKQIRTYVKYQIKTTAINAIGGESYLYGEPNKCVFYTNSKSIINDAKYNKYTNIHCIDYNKDKIMLNECDTVINISKLNINILNQVNTSYSNRIIIINCHHQDFWKKYKSLFNYKLITRKKIIDAKLGYFITINIFIRKSFISLGGNCAITYHLNKLKLRNTAYPFDWSLIKITQVIKVLDMDFKNYDDIKIVKYSNNHNSYLISNGYANFAHEVLETMDLQLFKNKLCERINRFTCIKNPVFIRIETFHYNNEKIYTQYCIKLVNILHKYFENFKIILISKINPCISNIIWFPYKFNENWKNNHLNWIKILQ
jgi:hypothetical protein